MIRRYQGAGGLGESSRKPKHADVPEVMGEALCFSYVGRLERQSRRNLPMECPLLLPGLSDTGTGTKHKISACNKGDAARHSLLFFLQTK